MLGRNPEVDDPVAPRRNTPEGRSATAIGLRSRRSDRTLRERARIASPASVGLNALARTNDETGANLGFEGADALCHPRRRDVEATGGFGDRADVDHHHEAVEEAAVHSKQIYLLKL